MTPSHKIYAQHVYMTLHSSHIRVKEIAYHSTSGHKSDGENRIILENDLRDFEPHPAS
jgi:hypothetical protein